MRMIFPHPTQLILADCCPLPMAVIILVFLPPFQDLSPLLSLSSPSFLKEWQMQCSITQSYLCCRRQAVKLGEVKRTQPCRGRKLAEQSCISAVLGRSETQRARSLLRFILSCLGAFCK